MPFVSNGPMKRPVLERKKLDKNLDDFRRGARAWLEENCPASMREPVRDERDFCWGGRNWRFSSPDQEVWLRRMSERGWTAPEWPSAYGGGGLTTAQSKILREEMARIGARSPLFSFGLSMLGPALLKYGTEDQKRRFLPEIVRGEIRWCQGYSEPGAGSDLASLKTQARQEDGAFVVNGQKVWTSYADKADWIFCLVRTDPDAPKQLGISFLLFDMTMPGVSTRPIKLISGLSPFCETFFDDVRVPGDQLIGTLNRGWDVAKYLLAHEREMISSSSVLGNIRPVGPQLAPQLARNPVRRARAAMLDVRIHAYAACSELFSAELKSGAAHPAKPSLMKYLGTELNKSSQEMIVWAGGMAALEWDSVASDGGHAARRWLRSKGNSIEGGTSEIQLNIVAKHILALPSS